jgi:hypothetical protein
MQYSRRAGEARLHDLVEAVQRLAARLADLEEGLQRAAQLLFGHRARLRTMQRPVQLREQALQVLLQQAHAALRALIWRHAKVQGACKCGAAVS